MLSVLLSYGVDRNCHDIVCALHDAGARVMVDSGAFSAFSAGKSVGLDDYCRFLDKVGDKCWAYAALDVVSNRAETERNLDTMTRRGYRPTAVLTVDMPAAEARGLRGSDRLGRLLVAGGAAFGGAWFMARARAVADAASGYPGEDFFHGLAATGGALPALAPGMLSCDSSSHIATGQYAIVHGFDEASCRVFAVAKRADIVKPFRLWPRRAQETLLDAGLSAEDVASGGRMILHAANPINVLGAVAWLRFQRALERRGRHLFLAVSSNNTIWLTIDAIGRDLRVDRSKIASYRGARGLRSEWIAGVVRGAAERGVFA